MNPSARRAEHRFFLIMAVWFLLVTLAGFGPSIYFASQQGALALPFVVHGVVFFAWILLFLTQAVLVSSSKISLHRRLGVAGLVLLLLMIPTGFWPVIFKAAAGTKTVSGAGFNLTTLCLGYLLAFYALAKRCSPEIHKRMMLLATMVFSVAAADRVTAVALFMLDIDHDIRLLRKLLAIAPGLALLAFDVVVHKRIFPHTILAVAVTWLVIWFVVSNLLFEEIAGEQVIQWLRPLFGS